MSREQVMSRVRAALGMPNGLDASRRRAVADRLAHPPRHPRPAFARTEGEGRAQRFIACLESLGTDVVPIDDLAALPDAVAGLLDRVRSSSGGGAESRTPVGVGPPTPNPSPQGGGGPVRLVV